ncbi:MAG: transcriptional regulator, partial [Chloroflexia bacterium]
KHRLYQKLHLRIDVTELHHPDGRVIVFEAPSRRPGVPVRCDDTYWMRVGESLTPMSNDVLRRIFDELSPDYSSEVCPDATLDDLDPGAIDAFRALWRARSGAEALDRLDHEQLLTDAELIVNGQIRTRADLVRQATLPRTLEPGAS